MTTWFFVFISMFIVRYFLRKITILSMTDTRTLDAMMFCVLVIVVILSFLYIPFLKNIPLDIISFLFLLVIASCSQDLIKIWEFAGFKQFISPIIEVLALIIISYLLITWSWTQNVILKYPLLIIFSSIIIIALLARWKQLKIKEHLRFREVIKHVELPEKK